MVAIENHVSWHFLELGIPLLSAPSFVYMYSIFSTFVLKLTLFSCVDFGGLLEPIFTLLDLHFGSDLRTPDTCFPHLHFSPRFSLSSAVIRLLLSDVIFSTSIVHIGLHGLHFSSLCFMDLQVIEDIGWRACICSVGDGSYSWLSLWRSWLSI